MSFGVTMIRPANNPATKPELTDALIASVNTKSGKVLSLLQNAISEFSTQGEVAFANSFGAEDMVLTDIILHNHLAIEIFTLDTGRLPQETHDLIAEVEHNYETKLKVYFPRTDAVENYIQTNGTNAFYKSVELRKACCHIRKVEPLGRALKGKKAWVTGMRAAQAVTRANLSEREFDEGNKLEKFNPLSNWSEEEIWGYIRLHNIAYNKLHDQFYPSIGCAPCTRAVAVGEDVRAGRWWWEDPNSKECGIHVKK